MPRPAVLLVPALLALLAVGGCKGKKTPTAAPETEDASTAGPPVAKKVPHRMTLHGDERVDDYYWMRDDDRKDPEILAHLAAENAWTERVMAHTADLRTALFDEMIARIDPDDSSVPYFENGYWHYSVYTGEQEYAVYARKEGSLDADEEVVLDANALAEGHEYFALGGYAISPDNTLVAYATDTVSRRFYTVHFRNLDTGEALDDQLANTSGRIVWANDNQTVLYIAKDPQTGLGYQVFRHTLGTDQADDVLVYEETDPTFYTRIGKTKDRSQILISHDHTTKSGVTLLDADDVTAPLRPFLPIAEGHEYSVAKVGETYFVHTNRDATNFRIMKVDAAHTADTSRWVDVVPPDPDVHVQAMALFDAHLVVREKVDGVLRVRVMDHDGGNARTLAFDDPVFGVWFGANPEQSSTTVRLGYSSLTTPYTTYAYELAGDGRELLKQDTVVGDFDPADYASERITVTARDGAEVPVSVVYRKDTFAKDGTNPLYQYGYGSYGATMDPYFSSSRLTLLDRGVVYAIAHVRGSQMLGRPWYEDGKKLTKKNTFTDFIDVTKGLVAQGYAHPDKVYASGGSAGGLLTGAVANMAPELYLGIGAHVPFVDVVTTMLDETIPLTTNEYDEWGNPNDKVYYDYMKSYSPYDNVAAQDYPHLLVTTGLHDSQVQYFEPAKWVAKLREHKTDDNRLLFKVNMEAGHGGASGRYKRFEDRAFEYAFLFDLLGITE